MFKEEGFTIIEMLVVIGILSVLTSFVFINHRSSEAILSFEREAGHMLEGIRKTRDYAIASWYPQEGFLEGLGDEDVFHGGYGIRFEKNSRNYLLFADLEDERGFDENSIILEERELDEGVGVDNIKISGTDEDYLDIVYRPPDLFIFFNGYDAMENNLTAVITLISKEEGHTKDIKINPYGVPMYEQ